MDLLLGRADFLEENSTRPHSLKVTTISALMGEIVQGGDLAQLEVQGNYRAVTAQDMGGVYSRNLDQQQITVSNSAQQSPNGNQNAEGMAPCIPDFVGFPQGDSAALNTEVLGGETDGLRINGLAKTRTFGCSKTGRWGNTRSFRRKIRSSGRPNRCFYAN